MKLSKNNLKQNADGDVSGMLEIKNESIRNECENIIQSYSRKCPKCNVLLTYSSIGNLNLATKKNCCCRSCTSSGRSPSPETRKKMSISHNGFKHTDVHKRKIKGAGNPMYGIHRYDNLNPFYGKKHTDDSRRKMRIAACKRILKLQRSNDGRLNNIGKNETQYFDKLEKEHGWSGIRQYFIEELGYFVDYYEPTHNIVIEYDEPRHYKNGNLRPKDISRMNEIIKYLKCTFLRYKEYNKELIKYV